VEKVLQHWAQKPDSEGPRIEPGTLEEVEKWIQPFPWNVTLIREALEGSMEDQRYKTFYHRKSQNLIISL
jgi:hypothetical protein